METLSIKSPAKVNLFLEIIKKREDGFHDLESVFQTIPLCDTLSINPEDDFTLEVDTPTIPTDNSNLILKAAKLLQEISGKDGGAHFKLSKKIPSAGGLGGGSSNAAATLILLNKLWDLNISKKELAAIGSKIGSDVPFFIFGGICLCEGRGERVTPLNSVKPVPLNIIAPPWGISTPLAFKNLDRRRFNKVKISDFIKTIEDKNRTLLDIYSASFNHFEQTVFKLEPRQKELHEALINNHVMPRMSGSGSSVWVINEPQINLCNIIPAGCTVIM